MTTVFTVEQNGDELWWSVQELTSSSALEPGFIEQCVELGLIEVSGPPLQWRFNDEGRLLLNKAWRLHHDLEVHVSALPLVLQLIDELDELRQEAEALRLRLRHWEQNQHQGG
jgi:hypothetical protein